MIGYDVEHRSLSTQSPEVKAIVGILLAVKAAQEDTGDYDVRLALSLLVNAAGHMLAATDLSENTIDQLLRGMRPGAREVVAGLRRQGGSPLVKAGLLPTVGRA